MTAWVAVLAVGAGSLALRLGPVLALRARPLPPAVDRALQHAATAVLAALTALALRTRWLDDGTATPGAEGIAAVVAAAAVLAASRRTRSFGVAVAIGLGVLWGTVTTVGAF